MNKLFDKLKPGTVLTMLSDRRYAFADKSDGYFQVHKGDTLKVVELIPGYRGSTNDTFTIGHTRFTMPYMYGIKSLFMRHLPTGVLLVTHRVSDNLGSHFEITEAEITDWKFEYIDKFINKPRILEWMIAKILVDRGYEVFVHPLKPLTSYFNSSEVGKENAVPVKRLNNYLFKIYSVRTNAKLETCDFKYEMQVTHGYDVMVNHTVYTKDVLSNWFICDKYGRPLSLRNAEIDNAIGMEQYNSYSTIMFKINNWLQSLEEQLGMNSANFVDMLYHEYGNGTYGDSSEYLYNTGLWTREHKARPTKKEPRHIKMPMMSERERRGDERILQSWTKADDIAAIRLAIDHALDNNNKEQFDILTLHLKEVEGEDVNEEKDTYKAF